MNISGQNCINCGERIAVILGAHGCPQCGIAWHDDCADAADVCPRCSRSVTELEKEGQIERDQEEARKAAPGMAILNAVLISYVVVISAYVEVIQSGSNVGHTWLPFWRFLVFLVLWLNVYGGSALGRHVMAVLALLGICCLPYSYSRNVPLSLVVLAFALFTLWAMWGSPQVRTYQAWRLARKPARRK